MNGLFVGKDWFPNTAGGLNRYFYGQLEAMPGVDISGQAIVSALQPEQNSRIPIKAMASENAGLRQRISGCNALIRSALQEKPDFVNAHFALYSYSWINRLPADLPFIFTFHGPYAEEILQEAPGIKGRIRAMIARRLELKVYRRANQLVTLSEAFRQKLIQQYAISGDRVQVVPGGIQEAAYLSAPSREQARTLMGWPKDRPILFAVRRLARRMGLENLLSAMNTVVVDHPDVLLFIGGKGPLAGELLAQIEADNLSENVRLLGFLPEEELPLAYAAADLTIVPTVALEGFGLITAESLLCGTPVMGTPIGGTPEILQGLNPELLFAGTDPEDLTIGLNAFLGGDIAAPDRAACRAYGSKYGWSQVAPRLKRIFEGGRSE